MEPIKMVDLAGQHNRIKTELDDSIKSVMERCNFINGEEVRLFSKELADYLNVKHVILCANGTDAIQLAIMALDLPRGSEIIIPSFCYASAAEVVLLLGFKGVFIDSEYDGFNIDGALLEKHVTEKTKAIIAVHLFGQCCDMNQIKLVAEKYSLYIIEDNAQSLGAEYVFPNGVLKKAGTIGDFGTTSFFPTKILGCAGDGGALFTDNDDLAERAKMIANHGQKRKYMHELVGINSRLDTIQAAILLIKLKYIREYIESRCWAANEYNRLLQNIPLIKVPEVSSYSTHVFHQYTIKILNGKRDALVNYLSSHHIPSMVYYPIPLHFQKAYVEGRKTDLPISERLCEEVISLPMHTELTEDQISYISEKVGTFMSS